MKRGFIFSLNYYPRFVGGAEVAIKEITDRISRDDIEFHMITPRFDSALPKVEQVGNVLVHRIGFATKNPSIGDLRKFPLHLNKYLFQLTAAYYARRLHKTIPFDFTWAMMAHSCAIPAGQFKKMHPEVPYLLTLQEGDPPEVIEKMMRPVWSLFKSGFTSANELQAISTFLLKWGKRMGFTGEGVVIPNGTDVSYFSQTYSQDQIVAMQKEWRKKESETILITTSRLVHKNGIDLVIRALTLLPKTVSFCIYGIGPEEQRLKLLTKALELKDRVRFMGEIGREAMPLALQAADIFIRPSRSEGMGISFVEAMAAGLPVIATQEGGLADFLFDAKRNPQKQPTGWAVDTESPEQIAEAVQDILAHPEVVEQVTNNAKNMVAEKYDWDGIATQMQGLFDRLLEKR